MLTITDAERAFYESVIANPEGKTLTDLRYAYFLAALDGGLPTPDVSPQISEFFQDIEGYQSDAAQTLQHDAEGGLLWVTNG